MVFVLSRIADKRVRETLRRLSFRLGDSIPATGAEGGL